MLFTHPLFVTPAGDPALPGGVALWLGHPSVLIGCLALLGGYWLLVGPLRERVPGSGPVPFARIASFVLGVVVLFAALSGPIHEYGDCCLFSVHMVQHLMVTLLMPPLLLYGIPGWAFAALSRLPLVGPLGRRATRAAPAFVAFNLLFAVSHLVPIYELQMRDHGFHIALHLAFMATAVVMWWPVAGPPDVPAWPRLSPAVALLYLFFQITPGSVLGALIGLAADPLYPWYAAAPRVAGLPALYDQQLGALIMWVGGGFFWLLALAVVFFAWSAREEDEARGPLRGEAQAVRR